MKPKVSRCLLAAEAVLMDADRPLNAEEIASAALHRNLVRQWSPSPEHSVAQAIRKHIRVYGNEIGFEITVRGQMHYYSLKKSTHVSDRQHSRTSDVLSRYLQRRAGRAR